jgi:two-component system LytT family response regulator
VEDLDYIESVGNYALLHKRTENHVLRETLTNLEAKLPPRLFLRISRSILVNLERIKALQSTPRGEHLAVLQDDRQLMMTRGIKEIQERLQYPETPAGGLV